MDTPSSAVRFSGLTKGLPVGLESISLAEISTKGWNILREDVSLPAAILRSSALDQNSGVMNEFLETSGVSLCPHGKTTMSPQLFARQMAQGAWGMTVATPQQLRMARVFGHKRIVLANQLIGKLAIRYVLDELRDDPEFDFYCLVDSVDGVKQLIDVAQAHDCRRPLQVLLEIGAAGLRCGCRSKEDALRVARAVRDSDAKLALRGVEGFEGLFKLELQTGSSNPVTDFLNSVAEIAESLDKEKLFSGDEVLITAGGSSYFDLVAKMLGSISLSKPVRIVLRSGCYLIHDSGMYARFEKGRADRVRETKEPFQKAEAALEVWTYVQSVPEAELAILTAGKRDCSHDAGLPVPLKWFRPGLHTGPVALDDEYTVLALSDQHTHMRIPAHHELKVGDLIGLGISHPCTTFDKWKLLFVVDDAYNITSAIETYF